MGPISYETTRPVRERAKEEILRALKSSPLKALPTKALYEVIVDRSKYASRGTFYDTLRELREENRIWEIRSIDEHGRRVRYNLLNPEMDLEAIGRISWLKDHGVMAKLRATEEWFNRKKPLENDKWKVILVPETRWKELMRPFETPHWIPTEGDRLIEYLKELEKTRLFDHSQRFSLSQLPYLYALDR